MVFPPRERFLRWPNRAHWRATLGWSVALSGWWILVYGGADYVTALRASRLTIHLPVELRIPWVPEMAGVYLSLFPALWAAPFILHTRRELRTFSLRMMLMVGAAGICFLLFPAELAYPPAAEWEPSSALYALADRINLRYNCVPSLHVALALFCAFAYGVRAGGSLRAALYLWAAAVALSTLLLHQHHLLDVATGAALARVFAPPKKTRPAKPTSIKDRPKPC